MVISKIVITDSRGYVFTMDNNVLDEDEENFVLIQKSLSEIANGDNPSKYELEKRKGIIYVRFVGKD